MSNHENLELGGIIDDSRLGLFQIVIIIICFLIVMLDGFDTQSIAFVAPALRHEWGISPALFGPLFGVGLLGTMVGSILLGSVADRFGRKPLILFSTLLFGGMTLLCATAESVTVLGIYRFLAGIGLGGAIPNVIALVSEYVPKKLRSTLLVITFAGFPFGAVIGGIISARIIPLHGWESVFILGGALPLLLLPLILLLIPESLTFLVSKQGRQEAAAKVLGKLHIDTGIIPKLAEQSSRMLQDSRPVRSLFQDGRRNWTLLLWLLTFTTLLLAYFLVNWTPLILVDAGIPQDKAILGVVALNLGGIIGSIVLGYISDRYSPFLALGVAYGIGAIFVALVGIFIHASVPVLLGLIFLTGLTLFGAQLNISAIAARYYPVRMRSSGIGWSMGIGRVGSIIGPTVGGAFVALGLAMGQMYLIAALPAAIAFFAILAMSRNVPGSD